MTLAFSELKAVSVAAHLGSLSRAADALNLSQPALSRRIAEAEKSVGVPLFDRLPRGVKATEACLAFLSHAEIALTSIDDGVAAALQCREGAPPSISFGLLEVFCSPAITDCFRTALSKFGGAGIDIKVSNWSTSVSSDLMSGKTKLGLRYRKDSSPQLESIWLTDDPVIVICGSSHPLARRTNVTVEELEGSQWVGAPMAIDRVSEYYNEGLRFLGFENWKTMEVATIYARIRLVEAGFGIALVRKACVENELQIGSVVELDTPLSMSLPIFLSWRRGAHLDGLAEEVTKQLGHQLIMPQPDPDGCELD